MNESRSISHDRGDESWESKALWFRSLSLEDRMNVFNDLTDLILSQQPDAIRNKCHAEPVPGRIQVLDLADLIASKTASAREIDLSDVRALEARPPRSEPST